jgi:5-methylthioadenosine/S-adenosylhomocysteine deaminase
MSDTTILPPDNGISRRQLLGGAAMLGASTLIAKGVQAATAEATTIFTNTTVVTNDSNWTMLTDVALAVQNGIIVDIGPTDPIVARYPGAELYDGRGKALMPGLMNCHAHLTATLERGFNEDFGFPNSYQLTISPRTLISDEENALMAVIGALEAIRCGTTTVVQVAGSISAYADALAQTGLRWVFAESIRDRANGTGPMSPPKLAASEPPTFSDSMLAEGMQRVHDLYDSWHGRHNGRIQVFPAAAMPEDTSPALLKAVREFAEQRDLGYTIHLNQSMPEVDFVRRYHGMRPTEYLHRHDFLGPRLFAAHCRYLDDNEVNLLGSTGSIVTNQAAMAGNRGVNPPIHALRAAGSPIAQGTDNNNNDMLTVMRIAMIMERIQRNDELPGLRPQPEDMLRDAAMGGAMAIQQPQFLGSLEVGKKADLIVLDTIKPHLAPAGRILSAWVHNGQPSDVESVMVDGQFVMRNHRILTVDEASLVAEADRVGRRVWGRVMDAEGQIVLPR